MTICISIITSEGIVLATDSASTLVSADGSVANVSRFAKKLCQIGDFPVGIMAWGLSSINSRTIYSLAEEFSRSCDPSQMAEVSTLTNSLHQFINVHLGTQPNRNLGIAVSGYSANSYFPETWEINFSSNTVGSRRGPAQFGADWFGLAESLIRLLKGFDLGIIQKLKSQHSFTDQQIADLLNGLEYQIPWATMPIQESIDCAVWLIRTVIGRYRFAIGAPFCDGPVRVAIITKEKGFQWIKPEVLQYSSE